jgi:hypothetical protein
MLGILILGCTSNTIMKKPNDLIPKKEMINVMTDIYIANAAMTVQDKNGERNRNYMSLVYEKYDVDSAQYSRSNLYYLSRIDEYEKMHKEVMERISEMRIAKDKEFRIYDSIKRANTIKK